MFPAGHHETALHRNLGWKLLSLLIAIALWIAVAREPGSRPIAVGFRGFKICATIWISTATCPIACTWRFHGTSGSLTRDNLSTVAVVLDLADAHAGERTYSIRGRNLNLPAGVVFIARFLRNSPCTLTSWSSRKSPCSLST